MQEESRARWRDSSGSSAGRDSEVRPGLPPTPHQNAVDLTAEPWCLQDPGGVMGADKSWEEMNSEERQAVRLLGWTAESWADDAYEPYAAPSSAEIRPLRPRVLARLTVVRWRLGRFDRPWDELSAAQQRAARSLGLAAEDFGALSLPSDDEMFGEGDEVW